ncbi:MAG TPA: DUF4126 domain-containing protein [Ktedonobacterales bacterium]|jgi:hypothetical protein
MDLFPEALAILLAALGLSSVAGLRAYFPLLAVAVGSNITGANGEPIIPLTPAFKHLGSGWFVALLIILVLAEFTVDKIPILDHISDALHTVIRPLSGAIIMAGTSNPISDHNIWAAAAVGAVLALVVHSTKAAGRTASTATTAGIANPFVSTAEDILTGVTSVVALLFAWLAVAAPIIGLALIIILAALLAYIVWRLVAALRKTRRLRTDAPIS